MRRFGTDFGIGFRASLTALVMMAPVMMAPVMMVLPGGAGAEPVGLPLSPLAGVEKIAAPLPFLRALSGRIAMGESPEMVRGLLGKSGLEVSAVQKLPSVSGAQLVVAWPKDVPGEEPCAPRAAPLECPSIRVFFAPDGHGRMRSRRIEIFDTMNGGGQAGMNAGMLRAALEARLGPPDAVRETDDLARGGPRRLVTLLWREEGREALEAVMVFERGPGIGTGPDSQPLGLALRLSLDTPDE
ncbi:hypothetical protein IAI18_14895 [Acetobacteraceae bacterium H6797]|nr:hypothetical protein [Acetobacteraceae bacterium H6797]